MNAKPVIRQMLDRARMVSNMLLADLSDADLLVRPAPGANHIAWQLGHLICSENQMVESIQPGSMPALPAGFAEKYTKETAESDDPGNFTSKDEYLRLYQQQREATLKLLDTIADADMQKPSPEPMRQIGPTMADMFSLVSDHEVMHGGQFSSVRRILGKPRVF
jgi:uncharacterized damage-inducible protein DinB